MFTGGFADEHRNLLTIFSSVNIFRNFDFTIFHIELEKLHDIDRLAYVNYAVAAKCALPFASGQLQVSFRSASGQLQVSFRSASGQLQVSFRSANSF